MTCTGSCDILPQTSNSNMKPIESPLYTLSDSLCDLGGRLEKSQHDKSATRKSPIR